MKLLLGRGPSRHQTEKDCGRGKHCNWRLFFSQQVLSISIPEGENTQHLSMFIIIIIGIGSSVYQVGLELTMQLRRITFWSSCSISPVLGLQMYTTMLSLYDDGDLTQGSVYARLVFYQLSYIFSPFIPVFLHFPWPIAWNTLQVASHLLDKK